MEDVGALPRAQQTLPMGRIAMPLRMRMLGRGDALPEEGLRRKPLHQ